MLYDNINLIIAHFIDKEKVMRTSFVLIIMSILIVSAQAAQVFLLDNDNNSTFWDPDDFEVYNCDEGISNTFDQLQIEYDKGANLPEDLNSYDALFISLGTWCIS